MESSSPTPTAPVVLVVMVAHDPGEWFDESLAAVASQDYDTLRLLVVDAGSAVDQTARVRAVAPGAEVVRLEDNPGFGSAVNRVRDRFGDASFLLLSHDDVRPDPSAVRVMVEEAFRSNVGIIGPKLVDWAHPDRLLAVGTAVDKTGVPAAYVDRGELDQQQHDGVRDVFAVPGAFTLMRADLFEAVDGFDPEITFLGDDVDLCWRSHVVGARIMVVPSARVGHLEALGLRRPEDDRRRLQARHRLRTMLVSYGRANRARVLPQAALFALVEAVYALLVGRVAQASDVASAWTWNLRRRADARSRRRALASHRQARDREIRRLQVHGSARLSAFLRGQIGTGDDPIAGIAGAGRELAGSLRTRSAQIVAGAWVAALLLLVIGSRELLLDSVPTVGQFASFPDGGGEVLSEWLSGWRRAGLGSTAPAPTAFGALGVLGYLFLGAMGTLRQLLILGLLPLGLLGIWRLLAPSRSWAGRLVGLGVYAVVPVGFNAVARGHWAGLVIYAAAPWIIGHLARASGSAPWDLSGGRASRTIAQRVLALGLLLAVVALLAPVALLVVPLIALGVLGGSYLVGASVSARRLLTVSLAGPALALVLHVPWSLDLARTDWQTVAGAGSSDVGVMDLGEILRFESGPLGAAPLGWAFLLAGVFALVVGRDWRLAWAARGWTIAMVCWGLLWVGEQGWLPVGLPQAEVLLAPAAVGIAMAAAMGVSVFETDLREYHFGWRQAVGLLSATAVAAAALPVLGSALVEGDWGAPSRDFDTTLSVLGEDEPGGFRMLWLGDPEVLPLAAWSVDDDVAFGTSTNGPPIVQDVWSASEAGATERLGAAVAAALAGDSSRLGSDIGPMGVRYVVVPLQIAPDAPTGVAPPAELLSALEDQLDLARIDLTSSLLVYENDAWVPVPAAVASGDGDELLPDTGPVAVGEPALRPQGFTGYSGEIPADRALYLANAYSSRWHMTIDGRTVEHEEASGWANAFAPSDGGQADVGFDTPMTRSLFLAVQVALWLLVTIAVIRARAATDEELVATRRRRLARRVDEISEPA